MFLGKFVSLVQVSSTEQNADPLNSIQDLPKTRHKPGDWLLSQVKSSGL